MSTCGDRMILSPELISCLPRVLAEWTHSLGGMGSRPRSPHWRGREKRLNGRERERGEREREGRERERERAVRFSMYVPNFMPLTSKSSISGSIP